MSLWDTGRWKCKILFSKFIGTLPYDKGSISTTIFLGIRSYEDMSKVYFNVATPLWSTIASPFQHGQHHHPEWYQPESFVSAMTWRKVEGILTELGTVSVYNPKKDTTTQSLKRNIWKQKTGRRLMLLFCYPAEQVNNAVAEGIHIYKQLRIRNVKRRGGGAALFFWRAMRKKMKRYWIK